VRQKLGWFGAVALGAAAAVLAARQGTHRAVAREPFPAQAAKTPKIEPGEVTAGELASFLGITVRTFRYSGGRVRVWYEVEKDGETTRHPRDGVRDPNDDPKAESGKILLWVKPGTISLRLHSGIAQGGYSQGLPTDALWWGWKSYSTTEQSKSAPVTPAEGEEVTLLNYEVREGPSDTKPPGEAKQIILRLKAKFGDDGK
jgi:hypothetical protein